MPKMALKHKTGKTQRVHICSLIKACAVCYLMLQHSKVKTKDMDETEYKLHAS